MVPGPLRIRARPPYSKETGWTTASATNTAVPGQFVTDVPATVPRALLPEYIAGLIRERSPRIGRIRDLRIL